MHKPNKRPAPAYQEFASDMLAKREYRLLGFPEKGLLWQMKLECWVNKSLPSRKSEFARMFSIDENAVEYLLTPNVLSFFHEIDGSLFCTELEAYRENLEATKLALSEGGKKGGKATQKKHREVQATLEGKVNPLSRDEKNRYEESGVKLIKEDVMNEHQEWMSAYDEVSPIVNRSAKEQARIF